VKRDELQALPDFEQCVKWLRSADALTFECGYYGLLPRVCEFRDKLVRLLLIETVPRMRARFVELLGETEDPSLVEIFQTELASGEPETIRWALTALERIGQKQIADEYRRIHPQYD
jgi:hypothetical protein